MKKHSFICTVCIAVALACGFGASADVLDLDEYTTLAMPTPGLWNTNFKISREFAEANHIPIVMYYGAIGCVHADKGIMMLNEQIIKDWFAEKAVIMIYKRAGNNTIQALNKAKSAESSVDPDLWEGRQWVKGKEKVSAYPIMRISWNKPDGTVVAVSFSALNKQMPVTTPSGTSSTALAGQFLCTLNKYLASYVPGDYPTPSAESISQSEDDSKDDQDGDNQDIGASEYEPGMGSSDLGSSGGDTDTPAVIDSEIEVPVVENFGKKSLKYQSCLFNAGGGFEGIISMTASKAAVRGVVRLSGKVTDLSGKNYSLSGQTTADEHSFYKTIKGLGSVAIDFSDEEMIGTVGDFKIDGSAEVGGNLSAGEAVFSLADELPEMNGNYVIVHEALPTSEALTVSAKKLTTEKSGSVKWDSKAKELVVSENNPSALKLTYTPATGMFKGSFKVYQYLPKTNAKGETTGVQLKKINASVSGFVVDNIGIGKATVKDIGSFGVTIE